MIKTLKQEYKIAKEKYARLGVDTDKVLKILSKKQISLHCWQGDDVGGFEKPGSSLSDGGIQVTGNYPGKARNITELRQDLEKVFSLLPGKHRVNLHAIYGEFGDKYVDRDEYEPKHFNSWVDWAKRNKFGFDFNATLFSHPKASSGFTLSNINKGVRKFWVDHVKQCRIISEHIGKSLDNTCVHNLWIPDGMKDFSVDRGGYRKLLTQSLDEIYKTKLNKEYVKDSVESKLFGIGSEYYVVGSHEFYLGYAVKNGLMVCLDLGHFHPTESVADKISSVLHFVDGIVLHVSRGIRWDSDHVVVFDDTVRDVMHEVVRNNAVDKVYIALDYFDASLNRIGAWVTGARATLKALLYALLEPNDLLKKYEYEGNNFAKLALLEELKTMPVCDIWNYYCEQNSVTSGGTWINEVIEYETRVLNKRK